MSNNFSILIIDDEIQIRKLLEISLQTNNYKVSLAVNGKDGVFLAASHQPDLILLDLGLPDEDGQIILKKLREWFSNPIIILSVKNSEEEIVKAEDELKDLQKNRFGYNGDLFKKRQELIQPIQDKVFDAIQKLAQSRSYDFIFDKASGGAAMLYTNPQYDVSEEVLKKLGM